MQSILGSLPAWFDVHVFVSLVLWQLALLYTLPVGYWLYEVALYRTKRFRERETLDEVDLSAVQVRILTVDAVDVVRETVDALPPALDDVVVVAERDIDVEGATVLVVPPEFSCEATHKGRAIEWARRTHPTDREYVLYLDEDTIVSDLTSIPAADVVQFRERPARTGSLLTYLAEIYRIGFNVEQKGFQYLRVPLNAWGGGIAVRREIEDAVTWDTQTIVEDSVFAWRAILEAGASFHVADVFFENQAPPSVHAMVQQRRRWLTGTRMHNSILPYEYQVLYAIRDISWSISVFGPLFWIVSALEWFEVIPTVLMMVFLPEVYLSLVVIHFAFVYLWSIIGLYIYRASLVIVVLQLVLTPLVVLIHSFGALYGFVRPVKRFNVTKKVVRNTSTPDQRPPV